MQSPIRVHRKGLNLTQGQLALLLGVSPGMVAQWERAELSPPVARSKTMAKLMGLGEAGFQAELSAYRGQVRRGVAKRLSAALVA